MTDTIEFGKRINHSPLTISLVVSLLTSGLGAYIDKRLSILIFLIVFIILGCIYFPLNLPILYGHWQLEKHGISYYKMNSYKDKLKIVLFPSKTEFQFISYSQIKSFKVIENNKTYTLTDILTISPAKQSHLPWLRKPFLLRLIIHDDKIDLDLSYNQLHDPKNTLFRLSNVLEKLDKKIND